MDLDTVDAADFGQSLHGVGLNLLVRDVGRSLDFLRKVLGMEVFQSSDDFAILRSGSVLLQIHADHTYHSNPLAGILPETGTRGAGVELRLYEVDPETPWSACKTMRGQPCCRRQRISLTVCERPIFWTRTATVGCPVVL